MKRGTSRIKIEIIYNHNNILIYVVIIKTFRPLYTSTCQASVKIRVAFKEFLTEHFTYFYSYESNVSHSVVHIYGYIFLIFFITTDLLA